MQSFMSKSADSMETKLYEVLKEIGVELTSYHGGSLNGGDKKMVMNNSTYLFDELNCKLCDDDIDSLCQYIQLVFSYGMGHFHLQGSTIHQQKMLRCTRHLSMLLLPGSQARLHHHTQDTSHVETCCVANDKHRRGAGGWRIGLKSSTNWVKGYGDNLGQLRTYKYEQLQEHGCHVAMENINED